MTNATILPRSTAPRAARFARTAALSLLLAALAACGDNDGPTESAGASTIRFSYSGSGPEGSVQGTYEAQGDPSLAGAQITQTFAIGQRVASQTAFRVLSNVAHPAQQTADFADVTIPRLDVGSAEIDGVCPGELCPEVSLALEVQTTGVFDQAKYSCYLYEGRIRLNSISDNRAKGTFSGTGRCLGQEGTADLDQFIITGGTFDVKVIDVAS
ncbi:MAG TPA: hypothetical protein VLK84_30980 [Longimicrobium sp.]|nr:hypothetical protein [Longimicrobium sp.]